MIKLQDEELRINEINEAKNKIWENDEKRTIIRIETHSEFDGTYIAYFTRPSRRQLKNIQKKFKEDSMAFLETIALENVVYPSRQEFESFMDYNYGTCINAGSELLKSAGFDNNQITLKNEKSPS